MGEQWAGEDQPLEYAARALEMMGRGRGRDTLSLWPVTIADALKQLFSVQQHFSALSTSVDALCEQTMPTGQRRSVITITEKASLVPAH